MKELEKKFSELMEQYKCSCSNRDEHGCTDCMNMGIILDNPEIQIAFQYREAYQSLESKLELLTKCKWRSPEIFENCDCRGCRNKKLINSKEGVGE